MQASLQSKWISAILLIIPMALIFNHLVPFPYVFMIINVFALLAVYLQFESIAPLNFNKFGWRELKITLIAYGIFELGIDFVIQPLMNWAFDETADYSMFTPLEGNLSAAIGEEVLFRGFAFVQLKNIFGDKPWLIILVSSALFGFPHFYQGITGVILTFLIGLGFGYLYWKYKNIWINILVHGLIDTVFLTLAYLGYLDFYEMKLFGN